MNERRSNPYINFVARSVQGDCFADAAAIGLIVSSTPLTEARNDKLLCKRRTLRRLHKRFVPDSCFCLQNVTTFPKVVEILKPEIFLTGPIYDL